VLGSRSFAPAALAALAALAAGCARAPQQQGPQQYRLSNKQSERAELISKLKRDLIKVDRSITVTEKLIAQSRSAPYQPDLVFRQAELFVEKSRYRFHLEAQLNQEAQKRGSLVVPDVALLKQKAISLYERVLKEFPDYKDADKVRFFIAHEYRELGQYEKAIKAYQEVVDKHPKSPLMPEALLIIADYWFDKSDLDKAEGFYLKVLEAPPSAAHDLARYKLGWVWINRGKHGEAVKYFEAAARSSPVEGAESKALAVKGLALSDLVYSYTESRPAKGAIEYFEGLCDNSSSFEIVLEKLGNRYFIKQELDNAAPAYRRLLVMSRDFDRDPERATRLYETIKASKGKVTPRADDVRGLVRVAARARIDTRLGEKERREILEDLEVYSRDLSTTLQIQAQRRDPNIAESKPFADTRKKGKKDDTRLTAEEAREEAAANEARDTREQSEAKKLYSEAADAYEAYLELFRNEKHHVAMMKNRADSLYGATRFAEAGRQYEEVAKASQGNAREEPLYAALVGFQQGLRNPDKLSYFDRVDSRSGIRQLGAFYVKNFPRNERAPKVKFNMARSHYDDGQFKESGDLFTAFAADYPTDPDAVPAAHLALDSYHSLKDYKAMTEAGRRLLTVSALPATLLMEIKGIVAAAKTEELAEVVIATDTGGKDTVSRLFEIADDPARANTDIPEKALSTAFAQGVAQRDLKVVNEAARKIVARYPRSGAAANAVLTLARFATEMGDFDLAAAHYESMNDNFAGDPKALEALDTAATLRMMVGDTSKAVQDFERVASATKRGEAYAKLAEAKAQGLDWAGAESASSHALSADPGSVRAAAVLGQALLEQGKSAEAEQRLLAVGRNLQKAAQSDPEAMARVYFLWGEAMFRQFHALGPEELEKKAGMLQNLQQAYTSAAQMGGDWAIAGMYRLGQALGQLADSLEKVAEPAGLKEKERAEFRAALAKQSGELKNGASEAFGACVKKARELEVLTPFALGCATRREINPKLPMPAPVAALPAQRLAVQREALAKNPADTLALEGLGRAYLESGDLRRARLTLGRLLELDENRGPAHASLGFTLMKLGEPNLARVAFKRAIDLDARDEKAHANLAALMCRFGDDEGAKAELAFVKSAPTGPDVDSEWGACRR
jgi:tetratricopeptide (TPR) repeat protein